MKLVSMGLLAVALSGCAGMQAGKPAVSVLVDLDPASADRTIIVESITADRDGMLYLPDRVSNNIFRVDPKSPKPVVVGSIASRTADGKTVAPMPGGIAFDGKGDVYVAAGPFGEVVRIARAGLNPSAPGVAQTFATGVPGANGIAFDKRGNLYVSGGASGIVYRVAPGGGAGQPFVQIEKNVRTLPDGKAQQPIVANGIEFDAMGALHIADTSRGAIWKVAMDADGKPSKPVLLAQNAALEGADGMAFDPSGNLWVAVNELNAMVSVSPAGVVTTVARNGAKGPLEFPSAVVFVGKLAYVSNFDVPRRDNMDANGTTAKDGMGASIALITP
jgi:sugar lactone lactonase YvrE